jgi:hypothetical protein
VKENLTFRATKVNMMQEMLIDCAKFIIYYFKSNRGQITGPITVRPTGVVEV